MVGLYISPRRLKVSYTQLLSIGFLNVSGCMYCQGFGYRGLNNWNKVLGYLTPTCTFIISTLRFQHFHRLRAFRYDDNLTVLTGVSHIDCCKLDLIYAAHACYGNNSLLRAFHRLVTPTLAGSSGLSLWRSRTSKLRRVCQRRESKGAQAHTDKHLKIPPLIHKS